MPHSCIDSWPQREGERERGVSAVAAWPGNESSQIAILSVNSATTTTTTTGCVSSAGRDMHSFYHITIHLLAFGRGGPGYSAFGGGGKRNFLRLLFCL